MNGCLMHFSSYIWEDIQIDEKPLMFLGCWLNWHKAGFMNVMSSGF